MARHPPLDAQSPLLYGSLGKGSLARSSAAVPAEYEAYLSTYQQRFLRREARDLRFLGSGAMAAAGFHTSSSPRILLRAASDAAAVPTMREDGTAAAAAEEKKVRQKAKKAEASAEDCDEAVVGLSSVSARAKAANEAMRKGKGIFRASYLLLLALAQNARHLALQVPPALRAVRGMSREDWVRKLASWRTAAWETLQHYWVGTKLLAADVRISSRLLFKMAKGKELSRRERQQLTRTSADIFRLVPFAVFIIVPLAEFALPVFLRLFPNMLPSTFQDKMQEEEKLKKALKARLEMAKFLQETVGEMAKEVKGSRSGDAKKNAEALTQFMQKVRKGVRVTNEEIIKFASLFNDELTLDRLSRPRLISMCKYMGLQTFGTDAYLRYILRAKLKWIKEDDKQIMDEGVNSLTEGELRAALRERGMLGLRSVDDMRQQLRDWLDLSLTRAVPSSLLILSRAFLVAGKLKPEEVLQTTLSSLPDQVVEAVGASATPEDAVAERKRKLERLKEEEKLIKEEEAKDSLRQQLEEEQSRDVALDDMRVTTVRAAKARDLVKKKALEKREDLCKISAALATLAAGSSVAKERADFLRLVENEISLYNTAAAVEKRDGPEAAMDAYRAARQELAGGGGGGADGGVGGGDEQSGDEVSSALITRVDSMLHKLEKELDAVDAKIGNRWKILDTDSDGKVTPEEVASAAAYLKKSLGSDPVQELIASLAKDHEGKILVEDIVRLGSSEDPQHFEERKAAKH